MPDLTAPPQKVSIFGFLTELPGMQPALYPQALGPPSFLLALKAAAAPPPFSSDKHGLEMLSLEVMSFCLDRIMTSIKPTHANKPQSAK